MNCTVTVNGIDVVAECTYIVREHYGFDAVQFITMLAAFAILFMIYRSWHLDSGTHSDLTEPLLSEASEASDDDDDDEEDETKQNLVLTMV